jgi:hypothetical protein
MKFDYILKWERAQRWDIWMPHQGLSEIVIGKNNWL